MLLSADGLVKRKSALGAIATWVSAMISSVWCVLSKVESGFTNALS